jgi:hypothetical protein
LQRLPLTWCCGWSADASTAATQSVEEDEEGEEEVDEERHVSLCPGLVSFRKSGGEAEIEKEPQERGCKKALMTQKGK